MFEALHSPTSVTAICCAIAALVMVAGKSHRLRKFFAVVPPILLLCYAPALLGSIGVMPRQSPAYDWIATYLLPMGLFLLVVTTDIPAILRLGPRALVMMLIGTSGIIIGAIVSFALFHSFLPEKSWSMFAAISGSWIGGGANFSAVSESVEMPATFIGPAIMVDATVSFTWLGVVLFMARHQKWITRFYQPAPDAALPPEPDEDAKTPNSGTALSGEAVTITIGAGFLAAAVCMWAGQATFGYVTSAFATPPIVQGIFSGYTLGILYVTILAMALSFTYARRLDNLGATPIGYATQYIFFASLGAQADLGSILEMPVLLLAGVVLLATHIFVLAIASRIMRAPLYLPAIASIANLAGPSVAAIVGAEYRKSLATLGLLLGLFGTLLGTWAGLGVAVILRQIS